MENVRQNLRETPRRVDGIRLVVVVEGGKDLQDGTLHPGGSHHLVARG